MAKPMLVDPVKWFVAILYREQKNLEVACQELNQLWGAFDFVGTEHPFDKTDYYESEMGPDLKRRIVSFKALYPSEDIGSAKLRCNQLEEAFSNNQNRAVNLDVGYLDHHKVVLASVKGAGQKIHLGGGVFADLVYRYKAGGYQPMEWTFMDFRDGCYDQELLFIRGLYLAQLKKLKKSFAIV